MRNKTTDKTNEIPTDKEKVDCNKLLREYICTEDELVKLINHVNLYTVLQTQKLSLSFIKNYILNEDYQEFDNEKCITSETVARFQNYDVETIDKYMSQ